jgi:hypothetical protein
MHVQGKLLGTWSSAAGSSSIKAHMQVLVQKQRGNWTGSSQTAPEECAELPLKRINGRSEGFRGYPSDFLTLRWSLIARGALGNVNPAKPPDAALSIQVLCAFRA